MIDVIKMNLEDEGQVYLLVKYCDKICGEG